MKADANYFPSIKTEISDFCQEFAAVLAPFEAALETAREEIQVKTDRDALQRSLAGISDAHHRLDTLINKVEEQQAYVIIFGPLKSGKSTLMNAISATYVSEVTSLPAYPCLVHVKYGKDYKFVVSRYSGEKLTYADNRSLQLLIQESHTTLAERIRQVEETGEEFDPGVHYPDAIRRIDVEVPARNLKESLTVLVDTPGLYSRMKFGYDLMTREFRNSAACAVFVVKTDNLFLEQVFDEFNDLLDLFTRIFLVVNIDTNKRDLEPDGSFKPSIESQSPQEVIRAFESLVMSAPLRRAAEEGRLRIYPIDLLNSASASLKRANASDAAEAEAAAAPQTQEGSAETPAESDEENGDFSPNEVAELTAAARGTGDHPEESFAIFLNDLTAYLNSNDYLHEFMGDSLHQGKTIAAEVQNHCSNQTIEAFRERQASIRREAREAADRLTAVEKLEGLDWMKAFDRVRRQNRDAAQRFAEEIRKDTEERALSRLDAWFESDESLLQLQQDWSAMFDASRSKVEADSTQRSRSLVADSLGGIELGADFRRAIDGLEKILEPAVRAARATLESSKPEVTDCSVEIVPDDLKVRKGFWDWITFRTLGSMRRRIFGEPEAMDRPVPAAVKQKRLGEEGKDALKQKAVSRLSSVFPEGAVRVSEDLLGKYVETLGSELRRRLQVGKSEYTRKRADLERRLEDNRKVQELLDRLTLNSAEVIESIFSLREKYNAVSWESHESLVETTEIPESTDAEATVPPESTETDEQETSFPAV